MHKFLIPAIVLLLLSCSDQGLSPQDRDFNLLLRFGVGGRNELNTFQNTYTKDLVLDGSITVSLAFSQDELQAIEAKLVQADFFSYPDTFAVDTKDSLYVVIEPHSSYYFRVEYRSMVKTLYWDDSLVPIYTNARREKLYEIIAFISDILDRRPEIRNLPPARGGYL